jgi:dihydrofolate synthase/folylpolyglutamate synthase
LICSNHSRKAGRRQPFAVSGILWYSKGEYFSRKTEDKMTEEQWHSFIEDLRVRRSIDLGLENVERLLERLGSPQAKIPVIQIAGTNGKGSVGAYVANILKEAGYRTGHFSSPAVYAYEEMFQIDTKPVEKEKLIRLCEEIRVVCEQMEKDGYPHPTLFEVEAACAYLLFYREQCQIAVMEAGMGGAEDATNVVPCPVLSILTSIGIDHTRFLGNSMEEIAACKAGIIKKGSRAVSIRQMPEAQRVLKERSDSLSVPITFVTPPDIKDVTISVGKNGISQSFQTEEGMQLVVRNGGVYQIENAALAAASAVLLAEKGYAITNQHIKMGLYETRWRGRFGILSDDPLIVADGAHNPDAVKKLRQSIDSYFTNYKIVYIIGVLADKDYEKMLSLMAGAADTVVCVTPPGERALPAKTLARHAEQYYDTVYAAEDMEDACHTAVGFLGNREDALILAWGSLSYQSQLQECVNSRKNEHHK